ncbi:hypothetical protein AZA_80908 [Nitrospirillum viridazoti Y2]|nr:hypothetical protein AZA_80908 [Nitrospirillum amazonense Y2]
MQQGLLIGLAQRLEPVRIILRIGDLQAPGIGAADGQLVAGRLQRQDVPRVHR